MQLDAPAGAVRLLLHAPHANRFNANGQVHFFHIKGGGGGAKRCMQQALSCKQHPSAQPLSRAAV